MGFHFRGWFEAWMARVRSSTVSCSSPELLNGVARFLRARRVVLAFYRQGRRGRSSWGRASWGGRVLGEARTAVAARPAMVVAVASTGRVGARGELLWRQERVGL